MSQFAAVLARRDGARDFGSGLVARLAGESAHVGCLAAIGQSCERRHANRDIADILGLSPRAVMKHVEQLFFKLVVDNRTAAAALGLKTLMR